MNRVEKEFLQEPLEKLTSLIKDGTHGTHRDVEIGVPLLSAKDVRDGRLEIPNNCRRISERDYNLIHKNYEIKLDDILLTVVGTIGRCYLINGSEPRFSIQRSVAVIRPNGIDSTFLYQYLNADVFQSSLKDFTNASAQGGVYLGSLAKCKIIFPSSISEQRKIAEVLETIDHATYQTEALIAKQQRIKIGLMQELLTKGIDEHGNIRSENTHKFKDSPIGRIPIEWEVPKIDDLATRVGSGVTPKGGESAYQKDGILFIRSQNVHFRGLKLNDVAYISEEIHRSMKRSEVFENDVLLNITGASIGRCCYMPNLNCKANVNQHVCTIRLKKANRCDAAYLSYVIESSIGQNQILQFNAGGNREGLNYQQVRSFQIPWAKDGERLKVFTIINRLNETIETLNRELDKQYRLKTALMQDLLTGNKRVTPLLKETEVNH